MINNHKPKSFLLKLYITEKCNEKCKYCFLNKHEHEPLMFQELKKIIHDFIKILKKSSEIYNCKCKGHVLITGGNPFLRNEFYPLLSLLYKHRKFITYSVTSNGTSINDDTCFKLKSFKVSSVQLPLEGSREFHDKIRYEGSFYTIINALDVLHKNEIESDVLFTATKRNYKNFPKVCKICKAHNVSKIFAEKLMPNNKSKALNFSKCLNDNECKRYYKMIKMQQAKYYFNLLTNVKIDSIFSVKSFKQSHINSCSFRKNKNILTINDYGNIYTYKDVSIICGNIYESSLYDIYFNNPIFKSIAK